MQNTVMSASEELEKLAVKYATEAIQLERQGSRRLASAKYQRSVEVLLKLCALYPNAPQNRIYMEHVEAYQKRIKELQEHASDPSGDDQKHAGKAAKFEELVITEKPAVKWDEVADLKLAKKAIEEAITYPVRRPDLFPLGWPRGILFFGPPGCGKTLLAAAIATEIDAVFYSVDASSIMSKWLGESEKNVAQLFNVAREVSRNHQPAIIFIDEIDSLIGVRSEEVGGEIRMRNQFLKEMDNVIDKNKPLHIYVIGATNKPWVLDEPFIRRFQRRIYVPLPDTEARLEMFKIYSRNLALAEDVDLHQLAAMSDGYSGSDIRDIFQSVQIKVVREFFENGNAENKEVVPRSIRMNDLLEVLNTRKPSVSTQNLRNYEKWSEIYRAN